MKKLLFYSRWQETFVKFQKFIDFSNSFTLSQILSVEAPLKVVFYANNVYLCLIKEHSDQLLHFLEWYETPYRGKNLACLSPRRETIFLEIPN